MTFLTPLFFLGALALAVPVIIHLTHREKSDLVDFPSLMFLRRIPYRSVRRQRLRHLLLFALRCLALLLLVLAFARPYLQSETAAASSPLGPRELVILIDTSYSMGYLDALERAKVEVRSRLAALAPEDRVSLIAFSNAAEILNEPTSDPAALLPLVDGIALSASTTRYEPALKLAKQIMDQSVHPRREVVLLSDFQRIGWEGDEDAWLPAGTVLTPVDLSTADPSNLSVTDVVLERDQLSGRERLTVSARITNKAPEGAGPSSSQVRVELNGRELQSKPFELAANSSTTVSFEPLTLPAGVVRGTVRLAGDALTADDAFHFVVWPGQALSVLLVEGGGRRGERGSLYLERALAIGDRPSFRLDTRPARNLRASDFRGRDVVLLNDVPSLSDAAARLMTRFVEDGGGLVAILGEASGPNAYSGEAQKLLPSGLSAPTDRARDFGGSLSYLDYASPIFELFAAPHSGDFSSAKFFRYRSFRPAVTEGVLARYDDGAPALIDHRLGEGRVLIWTSTLDTFWNDLARQPVFLPFVHRLVEHAARYAEANPWYSVGEVADLTRYRELAGGDDADADERELVVSSPSSRTITLAPGASRPLITLSEQGFYEIRPAGVASADAASLASNLDLTESDLSSLDPEELVAAVTFHDAVSEDAEAAALTPAEQENRQRFWFYLLIVVFAIMALETVLGNRLSRAKTL